MNKEQLQRFTNYRLVYQDHEADLYPSRYISLSQSEINRLSALPNSEPFRVPGNTLIGKAYTSSTDPCQDGNYLIGKYA